MGALPGYVPARDSALLAWAANFSALITSSPGVYGLLASDAVAIAAAYGTFAAAYALLTSPTTKTAAAVAAKNTAKVEMLGVLRPYAQQISISPGVASADKIAVGVNPRTSTPSPITPPASNPVLTIQSASNLTLVLRYRDSAASVSVKSKPYGATSCELYGNTSATAITDPTELMHLVSATKSPLTVQLPALDVGKQLYLAARWKTRTGGYSPWSPIINFTVAGSA